MRKFTTKNKLGFSLLELMVVVAIIGVLATFAVPRFNIFRARARQGEAKSNLGVIFTLQEAFKIDKEKYYDGKKSVWGGADMLTGARAGRKKDGSGNECKANKLGFRLANCTAARYGYYIVNAGEDNFLSVAYAPSDKNSRIFPGCAGGNGENHKPSQSKSGKPKCSAATAWDNAAQAPKTGDSFCLDGQRVVDNYSDIVADTDCNE